jgi:hypothetical protein
MVITGLIAIGLFLIGSKAFGDLLRTMRRLAARQVDVETAVEETLEFELAVDPGSWPLSAAAAAIAATVAVVSYWSVLIATLPARLLLP